MICTSQTNSKCWQVHKIQILRIWLNFLFWKRNFSYFHHVQRLPVFISIFLSMEPSLEVGEEARLDERLVYPVFTGQFFCCYQVINNEEETFHLFIARSQYSSPCTHRYIIVYVCFYHQYSGLCPDDEENTLMRKKTCLLMAAAACLQQARTEGMMGVIKVRLHWRTTGIELLSKDLCLWLWNSTPYYHKDLQLSALRWYSICLILVSQFSFFWSFCMPV